ncbi:MAG: hypothetical protein HYR55_08030 [Acidobacteria bacterium]|nr:hypothetical protein [Acidobacteriota bacterium]
MAYLNLIHVSGVALLMGAALWIFASVFHPNNHNPNALVDPAWARTQIALLFFYALSGLGVTGLYLRLGEQFGLLGLIGFVLALLGSAFNVATSVDFAYVLPMVAKQTTPPKALNDMMKPGGPIPWALPLSGTYVLFFVPGYILLGIATLTTVALPSLAGWLLIIGIVASVVGVFGSAIFIIRRIGGVVFGIGLAWLGIVLLLA